MEMINPLGALAQAEQIRGARNQNRLADLQFQQTQTEIDNKSRLRSLMPQALKGDRAAMDQVAELDLDMWTKLDENQRAVAKERTAKLGSLLASVQSVPEQLRPLAYNQAAQRAVQELGLDPQSIPPYDPNQLRLMVDQHRKIEDILAQPKTSEFERKLELYKTDPAARELLSKSQTQVNINNAPKLPTGYQWIDPSNPDAGVAPIPGGPDDRQTPEAAAKTQMIESAISSASKFAEMIMPGGKLDRSLVAQMNSNLPFTQGRQARVLIRDAIEAKLRAESGAAVPDSEVARASERFMPSSLDNEETVIEKLGLLQDFLEGTSTKIRPDKGSSKKAEKGIVFSHPQLGNITEDDIQETMRQENMTREQVLQLFEAK